MTPCSVQGCNRKHQAKGYCAMHYKRAQRTGVVRHDDAPQLKVPNAGLVCRVHGCGRPAEYKLLCGGHYQRLRKHGTTGATAIRKKREPGSGGRWVDRNGYVILTVGGKKIAEHRHAMEQKLGRHLLPGENVHHKNGVKSDNRPENLELWVSFQPSGQRVADMISWAVEIIARYGSGNTGWAGK